MRKILLIPLLVSLISFSFSSEFKRDEILKKVANSISEENIYRTIKSLQDFGTRNTLSEQNSEKFGIGAARRWIFKEFSKIDGLKVDYDSYFIPKQGRRIVKDTELHNIVAVKKGKSERERIIIVNAHYDSISVSKDGKFHYEDWNTPAPGANDDASGVAALIEIARWISKFDTEATIHFVAFAGEEQGLIGSTLYAEKMKSLSKNVEAVLTMDMISNVKGGNGFLESGKVRIFSDDPNDSPSRELARYGKRIAEKILPSMKVELIFRADRFGRGGDHTPFVLEGFPGIRFTEARENYSVQHSPQDTIENLSVEYCANVARIVAILALSLALAPQKPEVYDEKNNPMIGRGNGYDAHLKWKFNGDIEKISEFRVWMRDTKSPFWERYFSAGKNQEFVLENVSIDDWTFGVSAIGENGFESLISIYRMPQRRKEEILFKELK